MKILDTRSCRMLIVPDEPALRGGRVAVRPDLMAGDTAVFRVDGRRGAMAAGVRTVARDEVPPGMLVVPESLANRLGLHPDARWQLAFTSAVPLVSLTLEAMVEDSADELWRAVRDDSDLVGQCLWTGHDVGSTVLEIGSRQFRVRAIDDTGRQELRSIDPSTKLDLFLPSARAGLDMVILADCSGSMEVDDLPVGERVGWSGGAYRTRLDALKEALLRMLQARMRTAGRESRVALLRFEEQTEQRFPPGEGMVPLDATSSRDVIAGFQDAVRKLNVSTSGTNIPGALLRAAEVLDKHGRPGNDRLIVLVSDGKTWVQDSAEKITGEVVFAKDDAVSLMAHLHRRRNVRLHALGISNDDLYNAWLRRGHRDGYGLRPDHPMLERLVEVGGGDPTRIGGIDVLEGYFSGLGTGLTRHVGKPAPAAPARRLSAGTIALLQQSAAGNASASGSERGRSAMRRLRDGMLEVNDYARRLAGRELGSWIPFDITDAVNLILTKEELLIPVRSQYEFEAVLLRLHKVITEQGPGRRKKDKAVRPDVLHDIYESYRAFNKRLNDMRQVYAHDKSSGSAEDQKDLTASVEALQHYLQVMKVDSDDAARWSQLRLLLLEDAATCTERALAAARNAASQLGATTTAPPPPQPAKPAGPADLSMEFDLRVRN